MWRKRRREWLLEVWQSSYSFSTKVRKGGTHIGNQFLRLGAKEISEIDRFSNLLPPDRTKMFSYLLANLSPSFFLPRLGRQTTLHAFCLDSNRSRTPGPFPRVRCRSLSEETNTHTVKFFAQEKEIPSFVLNTLELTIWNNRNWIRTPPSFHVGHCFHEL